MNAKRVTELLARADALARESEDPMAIYAVSQAKLYFASGPRTQDQALSIADEIERQLVLLPATHRWRIMEVQVRRLIISMQRGDLEGVQRATDTYGELARELRHAELQWHHRRLCIVQRMNRGEFAEAGPQLTELLERAQMLDLAGWRDLGALDLSILLRQTGDTRPFAAQASRQLKVHEYDPATARAIKIRSMVEFGLLGEAEAALQRLGIELLRNLPGDLHYLSTLANLAVAACACRAMTHAEALYDLLKPYPQFYVSDRSFHCEGSVSFFLGKLAQTLGRDRDAVAHLQQALEDNTRIGLEPQVTLTRHELARALVRTGDKKSLKRARTLANQTLETARRLGMQPLCLDAERLTAEL
jgi:hypothetical protein